MEISPEALFDLSTFSHRAIFHEALYPWEALTRLEDYLKRQKLGFIETSIPEGAYLINPELISIGKGTIVEPGAYIKGPCIIGMDCEVRHGAYIRGQVLVGDKCVVGHVSELKGSILLNKAHAAHFAYVGDSILGNRVNLGAGTKLANLRLDNGEVVIKFENEILKTGRRKLGAILGDDTQIGCNAVTNPGTITGKGGRCYPCVNMSGFIPKESAFKETL